MRISPILLLLALPACAGLEDAVPPGAIDGGAELQDGSARGDAGMMPPPNDGGTSADAGPSPGEREDLAADGAGCFNGEDDDNDMVIDCDQVSACGASPYCCVGTPSTGCCVLPGESAMANFATCSALDPRGCAAGPAFDWFGTPTPSLEGGAFVPYGDQVDDSGLILSDPLDPSSDRITLHATIAADVEGCGDCIDVLALGLADPVAVMNVRVVPDVAVMVRASLGDVALFIAGSVVAELPLDSDSHAYELTTSPDGSVTLSIDGAVSATARMTPRPGRVPLLYGRTHNRSGPSLPARAFDVRVTTAGCDIPSSLDRATSAVVPFTGVSWGPRVVSNPSALHEGAETLVAFSLSRDVHFAWESAGSWRLGGSGAVDMPVLAAGLNEALGDPELVRESDRYALYVTRSPFDGDRTIARAEGGAGHAETFGALTDVTLPSDAGPTSSPSVVLDGTTLLMAVRIEGTDGPAIALLRATDTSGMEFVWANVDRAGSIVVEPGSDFARFDYDEVSDPELVLDGANLARLYYAGRRGTRWSIGVRVSGDRNTWREPEGSAVLAGTGVGHESLWTRHPSATIVAGVVDLFYSASDGVALGIGRALGSAR